jgi:hypothetical protein
MLCPFGAELRSLKVSGTALAAGREKLDSRNFRPGANARSYLLSPLRG